MDDLSAFHKMDKKPHFASSTFISTYSSNSDFTSVLSSHTCYSSLQNFSSSISHGYIAIPYFPMAPAGCPKSSAPCRHHCLSPTSRSLPSAQPPLARWFNGCRIGVQWVNGVAKPYRERFFSFKLCNSRKVLKWLVNKHRPFYLPFCHKEVPSPMEADSLTQLLIGVRTYSLSPWPFSRHAQTSLTKSWSKSVP